MTTKEKTTVDFVKEAFARVQAAPTVNADSLLIWGGQFLADDLLGFMAQWEEVTHFAWAMVEEVSRFYVCAVKKPATVLPKPLYLLQQVRLFGSLGDLEIRRDMETCYWRFIGIKQQEGEPVDWPVKLGLGKFPYDDYWGSGEADNLREISEAYFSWRREKDEQRITPDWWPKDFPKERFNFLQQKQYLDNGRIAFIRYVDFNEVST